MDLATMQAQHRAQVAEAKRLSAEWESKSDPMPKAVADQIDAALGRADELKMGIDRALRTEAHERYQSEPASAPAMAMHHGWREAGPDEGNAEIDSKAWRSFEIKTVLGPREVRYHVPLAAQDSPSRKYSSAFEAYLRKGFHDMGPTDRKTLSEGTDTAGGFLVPEDYQRELLKKLPTMTAVRQLARIESTGRDIATFPRVNYTTDNKYTSGARVTWTGEQPSSSTVHRVTDPVFGQIKIPVHTAMASLPLTNDLLEDAVFDLEGYARDLLAETYALDEDDVFINGSGIGRPMGLLTEVNGNGPDYTVSGTSALIYTAADAHDGKRLNDLYYDVPGQYRARGVWMMNSATLQAAEDLVDGNQRPILRELNVASMGLGEPMVLKGKRIVVDEFVPDIGADTYPIIFGDFSGYLILERVGLSIKRLDEVHAEDNIVLLLARRRVGGYCIEDYKFRVMKAGTS